MEQRDPFSSPVLMSQQDVDVLQTILQTQQRKKIDPQIAAMELEAARKRGELLNMSIAFLGGVCTAAIVYVFYSAYKEAHPNTN